MYKPCNFDRDDYLSHSDIFEKMALIDTDSELSEFNEDPECLAYELAYTRYYLACAEKLLTGKSGTESGCGCDGYYQLFGCHRPGCLVDGLPAGGGNEK